MSDPKKPTYSAYRNVVYALYGIAVLGLIGLTATGVIKGIYFPETPANECGKPGRCPGTPRHEGVDSWRVHGSKH